MTVYTVQLDPSLPGFSFSERAEIYSAMSTLERLGLLSTARNPRRNANVKTPQAQAVLDALSKVGTLTAPELAERTGLKENSIRPVLVGLLKAGLVSRTLVPGSRKRYTWSCHNEGTER